MPDLFSKARTLREIRVACTLGALNAEEVKHFWVNTDAGRNPNRSVRQEIKTKLDDCADNDLHALVYGHGGCGKSTELIKLVEDLGAGFFAVTFSIRDEMNLTAVRAEDILLVLTERLLNKAKEEKLQVDETVLKPVLEYFAARTTETKEGRSSEAIFTGEASVGTPSILSSLLKLLAKFKGEIKLDVHSTETTVAMLRKRPADLLAQINNVISAVRQALPIDRRLLIIVEDLDKLDIASARQVFIENISLLTSIRTNVIYTIPIFTFHSPDAGILRAQFQGIFSLPMIKVINWTGKRAEGFDLVKKVVHHRIEPEAIQDDALELLIEKTGGVLQHVFEVLHTAALMTGAATPISRRQIEFGLAQKRSEFWSEITLPNTPIDGLTSNSQLYDRLAEYAEKQMMGIRNPPMAEPVDQVLLRSCALVEYNGERWYGVHPLVIDNLIELGRIKNPN